MRENIDILFYIEHVDRELDTAIEIKKYIQSKTKCTFVILSSIYHPVSSLLKFSPKIIVTPSTSFGKGSISWLFYKSSKIKPLFVNLNYEQFISKWKGKYKTAKHYVSLNHQIQFCWGEYFKNFLIRSGSVKENVLVTGRPYFSLIKKKYLNKNFKKKISSELKLDFSKKWNFIALTDGLAFINEKKVKNIINQGAIESGLRNHIKHVKETINILLNWINDLSKHNEKDIFILRPHPSISISQYNKLIINQIGYVPKNLIISKKYNAHMWLVSSEKFLTNYSTLAMDAKVLNKKFYIINPIKKLDTEDYWWCKDGFSLETFSEFLILINDDKDPFKIYESDLCIKDFIDIQKDGILETSNHLIRLLKTRKLNSNFSLFGFLCALLISPKRILGSLVRNFFMKINFNPYGIVKKGISVDYLKPIK